MTLILRNRNYRKVTPHDLIDRGWKPRLNYELVESEDRTLHEVLRCIYCSKTMTYDFEERGRLILEGRWDFHKDRIAHCGNSTCENFYRDELEARDKMYVDLFERLLDKGLAV